MVSGFLARPDIILSTGATLHKAGQTEIETAAQAAGALRPIAWDAAGILFALGVIGVGSLAVPIMTTGAYDLCQVSDWKASLHARQAGGETLLCLYGDLLAHRCRAQLPGLQPDPSAGLVRYRPGFLEPPAPAPHPAHDQ